MPPCDGVDTSNNQGSNVVNIGPQLAALGVRGWWHKATEGATFRDRYWPGARYGREAAGLRYGGPYHWLSPDGGSSVADQFASFESYVGDLHVGESIQLDIEDPGGISDSRAFECFDRWQERYPGRVLVYMGRWFMNSLIDRMLARYGSDLLWWLPWYDRSTLPSGLPTQPVVWQWAGGNPNSPVPGLNVAGVGIVDSNQFIDEGRLDGAAGYAEGWEPVSIPWCRNESLHGTHDWTFHCLEMCRVSWAIPTPVFPDAYSAWKGSHQRFDAPPAGAPVYWTNIARDVAGREEGHVAIQDWDPAYCWSIDLVRKGKVDRVPKDRVRTQWGGQYLGWTDDLEHVILDLYPPLPPQEDDMTPDELHAIVDPQLSALTVQVAELQKTLTGDFGNGVSMYGAAEGAYDLLRLDKHQFLDAVVAATAKQVLAGLPPSSNGYTLDQITAAFKGVINGTRLGVS